MNDQEYTVEEGIVPSEPLAPVQKPVYRYPVSFTGTGSEYFKIWIVNLLLIIVTCGIYYPWAKVRKSKYIYSNTMVDGVAFDYLAQGKTLLKGFLLALLVSLIYKFVVQSKEVWAFAIFALFVAVGLPWLLWKSLRFRLSVTTHRALPFSFTGTLSQSYQSLLPEIVLSLMALGFLLSASFDMQTEVLINKAKTMKEIAGFMKVFVLFVLSMVLLQPIFLFLFKKYQHNNYQWAGLRTSFKPTLWSFYKQWLLVLCVSLAAYLALVVVISIVTAVCAIIFSMNKASIFFDPLNYFLGLSIAGMAIFLILSLAAIFLLYFFVPLIIKAFYTSRFQNLIWNNTRANGVRFESTLRARSLLWLSLKNSLFVGVTLGLYWPFAVINNIKMKLSSVVVKTTKPLNELMVQSEVLQKERNPIGDSVANMFDIDISL
jgi:uncharacterized membrane protein YjgN (DUF898 family)